ncbi:MAG TPA: UDP-N-acetylmuramoyl-L-alanyl-D-glutamate--2,6-diaminopimelate ligase [Bryobacteraceae bacterium]|nr:UDP-N-acetylmuramoyl-L-alanyl-D-glutamate--2,6-diaminopimelate ligase [Bryobacteraceae bacterium]
MKLGEVLAGVPVRGQGTEAGSRFSEIEIRGLEYDSRRVEEGFLFFAFPGSRADGRQFAQAAVAAGAVAVVSESPAPERFPALWIEVDHGRRALALAARNFYCRPDERLALTGITGTNGKTTTSYLLDSVLRAAGHTTAVIGTIEYHLAGRVLPAANTTPESLDLVRLFVELEKAHGSHVTMEVSSHALELGRVYGLHFHTAVFTNLTRDHLDFHGTMESYFAAKKKLFEGTGAPPPRAAVLNRDDEAVRAIHPPEETEVYWYGLGQDATVRARNVSNDSAGLHFEVQFRKTRIPIASPLIGRINVYNILAACGAALSYGIEAETIARGIAGLPAVPGRFERIDEGQPFTVVVDYAHTDDALRNVIAVARGLEPKRVITLFGCGGDRDRAKRPLMGRAAAEASDLVVLTSDNPRSEDPIAIMNDALVGIQRTTVPRIIEPDRAVAIERAIQEAREGDIVILAGKGHESYQVLKDRTIPFDDRAVAREVLRKYGYRKTAESRGPEVGE